MSLHYHQLLRISTAVMAVVLVFQSGLLDQRSTELFSTTTSYLGATVGMSVGVPENEYNTITAELTRQRTLLAAREAEVTEREIAIARTEDTGGGADRTTYLLTAILFVQLVLIVLNYGLDYLRAREVRPVARG